MMRQLQQHQMTCPLCLGQGSARKEHLVLRWRSAEFKQELQAVVDEHAGRTVQDLFAVTCEDSWDVAVHIFDHDY